MYTSVLVEQHMVKMPPLHLPGNAVPTLDATCDKACQALPLLITERGAVLHYGDSYIVIQ